MTHCFHLARIAALVVTLSLVVGGSFGFSRPAQAQSAFPLTVTDDSGASAAFNSSPRRIVSLSPGHTETVFALGAGDRLVAVDTYSDYPEAAKAVQPRLTTYPSPSLEAVIGLRPDLVLSLTESDDQLNAIRRQGVPVLKLFPKDYQGTVDDIRKLGQVLDTVDAAEAIASDMEARRDAVAAAIAGAPSPTVYYELDASDPARPFAAGSVGFYGQLVDLAGGTNVFGDLPQDFAQVSAESVIQRNPQVIVMADTDSPFNAQTPDMLVARPGWDQIAAVQSGAIYPIQADLLSRPGPRLVDGLESLARLLHPERFALQSLRSLFAASLARAA